MRARACFAAARSFSSASSGLPSALVSSRASSWALKLRSPRRPRVSTAARRSSGSSPARSVWASATTSASRTPASLSSSSTIRISTAALSDGCRRSVSAAARRTSGSGERSRSCAITGLSARRTRLLMRGARRASGSGSAGWPLRASTKESPALDSMKSRPVSSARRRLSNRASSAPRARPSSSSASFSMLSRRVLRLLEPSPRKADSKSSDAADAATSRAAAAANHTRRMRFMRLHRQGCPGAARRDGPAIQRAHPSALTSTHFLIDAAAEASLNFGSVQFPHTHG